MKLKQEYSFLLKSISIVACKWYHNSHKYIKIPVCTTVTSPALQYSAIATLSWFIPH